MSAESTPGPRRLPFPAAILPRLKLRESRDVYWRISARSELTPRAYPTPRYRFDAPAGEFAGLYACESQLGTFAERYSELGRRIGVDEGGRYMLEIQPSRPLPLIDLHDIRTLAALELDERISVGDDYAVCQAWSAVIHERYPTVMGIRYRARKAGADTANVFLFLDRCSDALEIVSATRLDALEATVLRAADTYRLTVFFPFKP